MSTGDSKSALLEAAWELTVEAFGLSELERSPSQKASAKLFDQLKTNEIAHRAGLSTGAFYNRWATRDDFLDDFLDYALSVQRYPDPGELFSVFANVAEGSDYDVLHALAMTNGRRLESNPSYVIQSYLWAYCRDRGDIEVRLQAVFRELRTSVIPVYQTLLTHLGREMRPPFDIESGATLLNSQATGIASVRVVGGDHAPPVELYAWAVLALMPALTRSVGDDRDLASYLADELA